jgi:hypothetical protein
MNDDDYFVCFVCLFWWVDDICLILFVSVLFWGCATFLCTFFVRETPTVLRLLVSAERLSFLTV